jgi:hypothetical protein
MDRVGGNLTGPLSVGSSWRTTAARPAATRSPARGRQPRAARLPLLLPLVMLLKVSLRFDDVLRLWRCSDEPALAAPAHLPLGCHARVPPVRSGFVCMYVE